ncbi:hypothetical protein [Deinococcus aquaticus]|uniref:Uncharacterized protein n=1 Tax=Deinococcus aquaticus TaxID=328692 RepID=A0ABY7V2L3_9DEIO|nr:hypothetical protein [Deinococcus aquaticus]WDA59428.1 hypothetical protein M8445_04240 [Deinococcus aquaticus]
MNEIPAVLADEAAERWAAFDLGLMDWAQIMAWADGWILRLDTHPELLLDVSLSVTRPKDGATALKGMADESRRTTLVPYLKAIWREKWIAGEISSGEVVSGAWRAGQALPSDAEEWTHIHRLDHYLEEAIADWLPDEARKAAEHMLAQEVEVYLELIRNPYES